MPATDFNAQALDILRRMLSLDSPQQQAEVCDAVISATTHCRQGNGLMTNVMLDAARSIVTPATGTAARFGVRDPFTVKAVLSLESAAGPWDRPDESLRRDLMAGLVTISGGNDDRRHDLTAYLFGKPSVRQLTEGEARAIVAWLRPAKVDGAWTVEERARIEASQIWIATAA